MKRSLPLLLTTATLAAALTACGPAGQPPRGGAGSPGRAAGDATAVKAGTAVLPAFHGSVATGRDAVRSRVRYSWRRGCPVGPVELRLLRSTTGGWTGGCTGAS